MSGTVFRRWAVGAALLCGPLAHAAAPTSEAPASKRVSSEDSLVGVVVARYTLDLTSQQDGRLQGLEARLGERVTSGQVVARLELEPLQLEAAARQAQQQAAQAEVSRTELLLLQAQQRLKREQRIRQFTAAEVMETAETEVALAKVNVELAQARRAEAQALLDAARRNVEQARIRAPFAGRVTELYLVPGVIVGRATPILRLVSEELKLRFAVPEHLSPSVRSGTSVRVHLPALGLTLKGQVDSLAPEVDPSSRHQKAEAKLLIDAEVRERLATGLLAEVELAPAAVSKSAP
ncbi:efflux RND transporter periplasmic adaptor subunit [Myxococcus sp. SDU36]|uniref:efflux RND transporter periplasmic adaptor subunit n=1 Tax=Myxococcus sp. SDU36 TaxID=2831967 RepID=UPI002543944F|nr:efflux RND transporter periplasmic adaptor subunit [Myxococcus sp. SDU36]WIG95363.1 efflux RND transporter periplasmic adaptor subunit [Myxococcus sp. SDU36]